MKGSDRNKSCWCGSGKKYKKCHLGSDNQKKENHPGTDTDSRNKTGQPGSVINTCIDAHENEKCCAEDAGLGACSGKIRKAHPVSRGSGLSEISRSGKIIYYDLDHNDTKSKNNKLLLEAKERDTEVISVFYGFCEKHNHDLFSCFGNEDFTGRSDQCLEIACRNVSREHQEENKIIVPESQLHYDLCTNVLIVGSDLMKKHIKNIRDRFFQALAKKEYRFIQSLIIKFDTLLPYMFADTWTTYIDIYDRELQNVCETNSENIFMSSFTDKNCSYICMSWLDTNDAPGKIIAEQIKNLSPDKQSEIILLIAVMNLINVAFNPDWFESLNSEQRKLLDALAAATYPVKFSDIIPSPLVNSNVTFNLPKVERVFYSHNGI